jgi:hypothetical protein
MNNIKYVGMDVHKSIRGTIILATRRQVGVGTGDYPAAD